MCQSGAKIQEWSRHENGSLSGIDAVNLFHVDVYRQLIGSADTRI